jgi:hypothetical protein
MARSFSSLVQTAIDSGNFKYFFLVKLEFSSNYYFTSHYADISWDGQTWLSDGGVFEFDSPKFSSIVDREAYRVVITDLVDNMAAEFKAGVVGSDISVWVGIIDPITNLPLTGTDDMISLYKGYVDSPSIENNWDTKLASIEGTSPMADLDFVNVFMVSKDGMDQKSATDTSFDSIFEDSELTLKWGKKG